MAGEGDGKQSNPVLIVEDDPSIRKNLALLIEAEGYPTVSVANGHEALDRLRWGLRPSVILLDLRMTVMTGWEFRKAQKADPALSGIPVVALTAGKWKPNDLADFSERLEKPIDPDLLRTALVQYCGPPKPRRSGDFKKA